MNSMRRLALSAVLFAAAATAAPAQAATVVVNGSLSSGDPTFNPLGEGNPPTSIRGGAFPFDAYRFTVDTAGTYAIAATSKVFDTYLGLYQGAFDPQNPLANALQYDDDAGAATNSLINRSLSTGVQYFAVVTKFRPSSRGSYALSLSGPGTATIGGAVPEPATWAMMILSLGAVGFAMRSAQHRRVQRRPA
jgi:hypothetical protein